MMANFPLDVGGDAIEQRAVFEQVMTAQPLPQLRAEELIERQEQQDHEHEREFLRRWNEPRTIGPQLAWLVPRPGLFERLGTAERVVHVSASAGSGKTFLLRSWIAAEGLGDRVAWVSVGRQEHDGQAFWLSVLDSLRGTRVGSERERELTAAPDLDGATIVRRLLEDLGSVDERLWLVIDDLHELQAEEAVRQVERLLAQCAAGAAVGAVDASRSAPGAASLAGRGGADRDTRRGSALHRGGIARAAGRCVLVKRSAYDGETSASKPC
jgi:hypothetical protein